MTLIYMLNEDGSHNKMPCCRYKPLYKCHAGKTQTTLRKHYRIMYKR